MFIYVFNEADRDRMAAARFTLVCADSGAGAWVFTDPSGSCAVPDGIEKVVSSRLTFPGAKGKSKTGGGRHGTENDAAL